MQGSAENTSFLKGQETQAKYFGQVLAEYLQNPILDEINKEYLSGALEFIDDVKDSLEEGAGKSDTLVFRVRSTVYGALPLARGREALQMSFYRSWIDDILHEREVSSDHIAEMADFFTAYGNGIRRL